MKTAVIKGYGYQVERQTNIHGERLHEKRSTKSGEEKTTDQRRKRRDRRISNTRRNTGSERSEPPI